MTATAPRLEDLRNQVDELLRVLDEENAALGQSDLRQLDPVLVRKRLLLENLAAFTADQLAQAKDGSPEWDDFTGKLDECQHRNLVNGATMSEMMRMRQGALRVLTGRSAVPDAGPYGSTGRVDRDGDSRELGKA
ncbi:MAG: flagellar protein FlgN [Xanthomonadales bacterium]|nr:flagellar protein FlgN [Xanthomonadales bacterium]